MKVAISTLLAEKEFSEVFSIGPEASVLDAVKEMNRRQIGSMLILDEGKLVGIFTERDVLRRVVVEGLAPATTPISEVMTKEVDTFPPDLSVDEAMAHMTLKRHRHIRWWKTIAFWEWSPSATSRVGCPTPSKAKLKTCSITLPAHIMSDGEVEWWNGGVMEWWSDGMVEWWRKGGRLLITDY